MAKVFLAMVLALACLAVGESLTCTKCTFNIMGICLDQTTQNCTTNTSVCYTDQYSIGIFSKTITFNNTGCRNDTTTCTNILSSNGTASLPVSFLYNISTTCCNTTNCNRLYINAAPSVKMTFSAAIGGAVLASMLGSFW